MDKLKKSFSLHRKKKVKTPEDDPNNKPVSWQEDEKKVREGCCSFQVKYLGFIEVFDSRGMQVCEEAIKALSRPKKKAIRAILYVSGDTIRVSDEISKGLVVDQTIEKVSFCSPDRNHKRGFAYICRDGTTRRWMCHAFFAIKETGERLSHAVGCAFAICLEKKQKRESTDTTQPMAMDSRTFLKASSFRQTSLSERLQDPQSAIIADLPQSMSPHLSAINCASPDHSRAAVIPRPHASASFFSERQTSLRMFPKLQESSPFKRELSLRLAELPGSSPISRKTESSFNEDGNTYDSNDNKDASGRLSAFSTFTKNVYTSDNSAADSPAHWMSSSFQSDSPNLLHNNPFLLSGAINYGASSTFTSQDCINNGTDTKQETAGNGIHTRVEQSRPLSFHKIQNTDTAPVKQETSPENGFPAIANFDNTPSIWRDKSPFNFIKPANETCSTNPWSELNNPIQSTFSHDCVVLNTTQSNPVSKPTNEPLSATSISQSDPFDISWINSNGVKETSELWTVGLVSNNNSSNNNPFRT